MITPEHFKLLAAYNRWANARLYAAALDLSDLSYGLQTGVYFGSLHGTLNHLLLTDRFWLKRLTGEGDHPNDDAKRRRLHYRAAGREAQRAQVANRNGSGETSCQDTMGRRSWRGWRCYRR